MKRRIQNLRISEDGKKMSLQRRSQTAIASQFKLEVHTAQNQIPAASSPTHPLAPCLLGQFPDCQEKPGKPPT